MANSHEFENVKAFKTNDWFFKYDKATRYVGAEYPDGGRQSICEVKNRQLTDEFGEVIADCLNNIGVLENLRESNKAMAAVLTKIADYLGVEQGDVPGLLEEITMLKESTGLNCDDVERLCLALSWMGYSTPEGLENCCAIQVSLMRDLIEAVLDLKRRRQEDHSEPIDPLKLEELIDRTRREERKRMWDQINSHIKEGKLSGNGFDKTAQRNGLIHAANIICQFGI